MAWCFGVLRPETLLAGGWEKMEVSPLTWVAVGVLRGGVGVTALACGREALLSTSTPLIWV